jgi:hypothetical protein
LLGWFDSDAFFDPLFGDKYEPLPDNENALSQNEIYDIRENIINDFLYYYDIWLTCYRYGLPHGSGWNNEAPWLISFLHSFDGVFNMVQSWNIKKGNS